MKTKKAFEIMNRYGIKNQVEVYYSQDSNGEVVDLEFIGAESIERILDLMDKDTAKAPVHVWSYYYDCPSCGWTVTYDEEGYLAVETYCNECGQKIDYSECEDIQALLNFRECKE